MPADRLFHPRAGHSRKVSSLTDFDFRVWWTYLMAADDYGVMRCSPVTIQAANDAFVRRPLKLIARALERLLQIGLIVDFIHQDVRYVCQLDWQDFQKVRYPRDSHDPSPPPEIMQLCSRDTSEMFRKRFGKIPETFPESSGNISEVSPESSGSISETSPQSSGKVSETLRSLPRAGARQTANGKRLTANGLEGESEGKPKKLSGHQRHAFCPPDGMNGFCVPEFLHREFTTMLGHRAEAFDLLTWYHTQDAERRRQQPVVPDALEWWRQELRAAIRARGWVKVAGLGVASPQSAAFECPHTPRCLGRNACDVLIRIGKVTSQP